MHKSFAELRASLFEASQLVEKGAVYRHHKDPESRYLLRELVINEADDEVFVEYFPSVAPDINLVRSLASWLEEVDGQPLYQNPIK